MDLEEYASIVDRVVKRYPHLAGSAWCPKPFAFAACSSELDMLTAAEVYRLSKIAAGTDRVHNAAGDVLHRITSGGLETPEKLAELSKRSIDRMEPGGKKCTDGPKR